MDTELTLREYLATKQPNAFRRQPAYSKAGDYVIYLQEDVPYFAERIDEVVTVYRASESRCLIGCKVKGVADVLKAGGSFGVAVGDGVLTLGFFFQAASAGSAVAGANARYEELRPLWDVPVDHRDFIPA